MIAFDAFLAYATYQSVGHHLNPREKEDVPKIYRLQAVALGAIFLANLAVSKRATYALKKSVSQLLFHVVTRAFIQLCASGVVPNKKGLHLGLLAVGVSPLILKVQQDSVKEIVPYVGRLTLWQHFPGICLSIQHMQFIHAKAHLQIKMRALASNTLFVSKLMSERWAPFFALVGNQINFASVPLGKKGVIGPVAQLFLSQPLLNLCLKRIAG